jgi:peptidoglycan DL-endopeptidase CwlO
VAPHRLKHTIRGALALTAVATVVGLNPGPAVAAPPSNLQDAQAQLDAANKAAEAADQAYLAAQDEYNKDQAQVAKATSDIQTYTKQRADAQAKEEQFRGQVDQLAAAAYSGARFTQLSALLTGNSAREFLDQSSELQLLAANNAQIMDTYDTAIKTASSAKDKAAAAQKTARTAADAAQKVLADLGAKKQTADAAVAQSQSIYNQLNVAAKQHLGAAGDLGVFVGPPGPAGTAMDVAVSQRGVLYVWGGTTPAGFDCSGLMLWSYAHAGITLPRSAAAQYTVGTSVSMDALQPGDLIFYGPSASAIHHVSMYVGGGEVVHAPTEGEVVKIVPISHSGSDIFGAKRIVG